jgi:hypothetical protein
MIQRIQTLYLLGVVVASGLLELWLPLWINNKGIVIMPMGELPVFISFLTSALLALLAIFKFKNRKLQFVLNRLNIILNLFLLGSFVYRTLNISGEAQVSEKGIGLLIPIISIVFLVLANKAIRRDEELVKSVDRLR